MSDKRTRRFSKEYKAEDVDLVQQSGGNCAKVARDVDLTPQSVAAWVRQAAIDAGEGRADQLTTADKTELYNLRKEVKELRMEREFLKKIFNWFAQECR